MKDILKIGIVRILFVHFLYKQAQRGHL